MFLKEGLENYDRDHGWRGPIANIKLPKDADDQTPLTVIESTNGADKNTKTALLWHEKLAKILRPAGSGSWKLAIVLDVDRDVVKIGHQDGHFGFLLRQDNKWARKWINDEYKGPVVSHMKQVLNRGDVILVEAIQKPLQEKSKEPTKPDANTDSQPENDTANTADLEQDNSKENSTQETVMITKRHKGLPTYHLRQIPAVSGALIAMEPDSGRVLAMQGGYDFEMSQFNRATQAKRQTGSAFKPFSIIPALEQGLTPSTVLDDSPFAIDIGYGLGVWRPKNWDGKFKGAITLRRSFELSRNVAIIRMIHEDVGMNDVVDVAKRFGVDPNMPKELAGILGASETTPLKLTAAYAMIANGGKKVSPVFFDHIQDRRGKTIVRDSDFVCRGCARKSTNIVPVLLDNRPQVTDPITAYQMTSILRGAVERGLGRMMLELPHQVTAKSGTTNDFRDAWMMGYSPSLVVGVYIGFDTPRTLGIKHYGSKVAGPIFKEFMRRALEGRPVIPFRIPKGVKMTRVNAYTGARAEAGEPNTIYEAFRPGTELPDSYNAPSWDNPYEVAGEGGESNGYPDSLYGPRSSYASGGYTYRQRETGGNGQSHQQNAYSGPRSNSGSGSGAVAGTGGLY